jgi:hypothetical protein
MPVTNSEQHLLSNTQEECVFNFIMQHTSATLIKLCPEQVIKDLKLLGELLHQALARFRYMHSQNVSTSCMTAAAHKLQRTACRMKLWCCPGQAREQLLGELVQPVPCRQAEEQLRIVVFIDDLDRCKPSKIIEVCFCIRAQQTASELLR